MINYVNSWNGWDPLQQVILGNVYTPEFFEDMKDHISRDIIQKILYETREDLAGIKTVLESFEVDVVQLPDNLTVGGDVSYTNINEMYDQVTKADWKSMQSHKGLPKPALMPRDWMLTLGNELHFTDSPKLAKVLIDNKFVSKSIIKTYKNIYYDGNQFEYHAPCVTRLGSKILLDVEHNPALEQYYKEHHPKLKRGHTNFGWHNDGSFNVLRPGLIIAGYEDRHLGNYKKNMPEWERYYVPYQQFNDHDMGFQPHWGKRIGARPDVGGDDLAWWTPEAKDNPVFADFVGEWLNNWVGNYTETTFEINVLVIDSNHVLCIQYNKDVFDFLESRGITPVYAPFRHRRFWDGGPHCLTLDTVRMGSCQNYFN